MGKRAYIACSLEAALAAKNFGMKFHVPESEEYSEEILYEYEILYGFLECVERLYIHPDSMPLLEPQIGDIVLSSENMPAVILKDGLSDNEMHAQYACSLSESRKWVGKEAYIIQRAGKPFPKIEWEDAA